MQSIGQQQPEGVGRGLLQADHSAEPEPPVSREHDAAAAGQAPEAELLRGGSRELAAAPERSLLSRHASMTNLLSGGGAEGEEAAQLTLCQRAGSCFAATMLLGTLGAIGFVILAFPSPYINGAPSCRSGSAMAVLPADANGSQRLVVWSGRGQTGAVYHGRYLHTFSLQDLLWDKVKEGTEGGTDKVRCSMQQQQQQGKKRQGQERHPEWAYKPPPMALPHGRWKAAVASLGGLGMLVHGGNAPDAAGSEQMHMSDAWLLRGTDMHWQVAVYHSGNSDSTASNRAPMAPSARHSHTMVAYQDEKGQQAILLFGGRRQDGLLLNDVWRGVMSWPNITWTLLSDPQSGVGSGPAPLPRAGHAAAMLNNSTLIIHGGRSEVYGSFADLWAFSLVDMRWQPLTPATSAQPAARDLHGIVAYDGKLLLFGGRFGTLAEASRPLGDRWLFDVDTRTWRMLPVRGLSPLPRFLFAHTQYTPNDGGAGQLLVFGGETGSGCRLNDVWSLSLYTHHWTQLSLPYFASRQCQKLFG